MDKDRIPLYTQNPWSAKRQYCVSAKLQHCVSAKPWSNSSNFLDMSTDAARHLNRATRQISRRRADVQRLPARLLIVTLVSPACCVVLVTVFSFRKDRSRRSSPVAAHARSSTVASRQGRSRKGGQQGGDGALRLLESCHASRQPELAGRCAHCLRRAFSCGSVQLRRGPHLLLPGLSVHWAMSVPCLRDSSLAPATRFPQNIG